MFLDQAIIHVKAGDGGNGCVSFRRERYVPRGGPDGGDGGRGGDVILVAEEGLTTLLDIGRQRSYVAQNGKHGSGQNRHGKSAPPLEIPVPPGTIIIDADTGLVLRDLKRPGDFAIVARGGKGGRGNKAFASPTNQVPRTAEPGEPGQERTLLLELKLIADVGLIGMPNAGKSTLISHISAAHPKIADYPFTTKNPVLGIVEVDEATRFVVADIPGLIEGAHRGVGLGDEFLRHVERTRLLAHVIDMHPIDGSDPIDAYRIVRKELEAYSTALAEKPELLVANKMDLQPDPSIVDRLRKETGRPVVEISAVTGQGLRGFVSTVWNMLRDIPADYTPIYIGGAHENDQEKRIF